MTLHSLALLASLALALAAPKAEPPPSPSEGLRPPAVEAKLERAKQEARKIPLQAQALAELAWPAGPPDPLLQAAARMELVEFGHEGLAALRGAMRTVEPLYQADVVAAFIEARYQVPAGLPSEFLPGLEEAVWFGSPEARRLALIELSRVSFPPAIPTAGDAAFEDPEIARVALRTLGRMGDTRGRVFLTEALLRGGAYYKPEAARALATLGGSALNILREAVRAEDPATRAAAVRALLPESGIDDLSILHEYAALNPTEDPALLQAIRERASVLEAEFDAERDAAAASGAQPTERQEGD